MTNYRPTSILPPISKVYEQNMYKRIMAFINANNILSHNQYGFRTKLSTIDAISQLIGHTLQGVDINQITLVVYLDMVNHNILTLKLRHIGIRGTALQHLSSYLSNRKQYCQLQNYESEQIELPPYGVPQGSVLGPLLFYYI